MLRHRQKQVQLYDNDDDDEYGPTSTRPVRIVKPELHQPPRATNNNQHMVVNVSPPPEEKKDEGKPPLPKVGPTGSPVQSQRKTTHGGSTNAGESRSQKQEKQEKRAASRHQTPLLTSQQSNKQHKAFMHIDLNSGGNVLHDDDSGSEKDMVFYAGTGGGSGAGGFSAAGGIGDVEGDDEADTHASLDSDSGLEITCQSSASANDATDGWYGDADESCDGIGKLLIGAKEANKFQNQNAKKKHNARRLSCAISDKVCLFLPLLLSSFSFSSFLFLRC